MQFRECQLKDAAVAVARCARLHELAILLEHHPCTLLPDVLHIFDALPETLPPDSYMQLVQQVSKFSPTAASGLSRLGKS